MHRGTIWAAGLATIVLLVLGTRLVCAPEPTPAAIDVPAATEMPRRVPARAMSAPTAEPTSTSAPQPAEPVAARRVRIGVVADAGGAPIEGAAVWVDEKHWAQTSAGSDLTTKLVRKIETTTGVDGVVEATLSGAAACLVVRKTGFLVARCSIDPAADEIRVPLVTAIVVRGRVTMADTHEPASGVPVRAWDTGKMDGFTRDALLDDVFSDADGHFELAGIPFGRQFRVVAARPGFRSADATLTLTESGPEIELVLGDGGVLFGVVVGKDGAPLADVDVFQVRPDMQELPRAPDDGHEMTYARDDLVTFLFPAVRTDAAGRYEFRGVRLPIDGVPQPRQAAARLASGRSARSEPATFTRHGERQQRDIRFGNPSSVTVTVKSTSTLPKGARVRCQGNGPGSRDTELPLPEDGEPIVFGDLPANLYFVSVSSGDEKPGRWTVTRRVQVSDGETPPVEFVIDDGSRIVGRVVDPEGRGIARISVEYSGVSDDGGLSGDAAAITNADGAFRLALPPVSGQITASPDMLDLFSRVVSSDGRARSPRYETVKIADVRPGDRPLTITLRRLGRLRGAFKPPPTQQHGSVRARACNHEAWAQLDVAADGRFECAAPLVGEAAVAWFDFGAGPTGVIDLPAIASDETRDVGEILLGPSRTLDGSLVDVEGHGLASAQIRTLEPWAAWRSVTSDVAGHFRLEGLPSRTLLIRVDATPTTPMTVLRVDPTTSPAVFTVAPGAVVKGHVLDAEGRPVPAAGVVVRPVGIADDCEDAYGYVTADSDGAFALRVQSGRAKLQAILRARGAPPEWVEIDVTDGQTRTLDLHLR